MHEWFSDGRRALATAIFFAVTVGAWMARYETLDNSGYWHRNRLTGAVCRVGHECWMESDPAKVRPD